MKIFYLPFVLVGLLGSPFPVSADSKTNPSVDAIEGSESVYLLKDGKQRVATVGVEIAYGENIKTGDQSSVSIIYPDGSKIIVAANSEYKIESKIDQTQWNRLSAGSVRGMIKKTPIPLSDKPKFLIRTKAAVLGVRGTDFVMSMGLNDGVAQINTLEGTVEVGHDEISVMSGKGTLVKDGQFLQGSRTGLNATQPFNKPEFLKTFKSGLSPGSISLSAPSATSSDSTSKVQTNEPTSAESHSYTPPPQGIPAPTKFPPPLLPHSINSDEPQKATPQYLRKTEEQSRSLNLFSFDTALFFTQAPSSSITRALSVAWTPTVPFPLVSFLAIRGHFGGEFAQDGSLNGNFLILDYQIYLVFTLLNPLFVEGGMGEQIWRGSHLYDAGLTTVNAGVLVKFGIIDRIFVGYQALNLQPSLNEYKAGIGFSF